MREEQLSARLGREGLTPYAWSNGAGDRYAPHRHGYDKVLVVAAGSITFGLPERGDATELQEGDRLELPAGTLHDALVGPRGVTCLEAHLPAGGLAHGLRAISGWGNDRPGPAVREG